MFTWFFGRRRVEDVIGLFSKATEQLNEIIDVRTEENFDVAELVSDLTYKIANNEAEIKRANRIATKIQELLS